MALEDAGSFIFGGSTGLSYEQLKQRRAIAQALASRQGGFPKNKGEGLTYLGQSIGEALSDLGLQRREAEALRRSGALRSGAGAPATTYTPSEQAPPATPPPASPPPAKTSDAGEGDTLAPVVAASTMDTDEAPTTSVAGFSDTAPVAPWPTTVAATSEQPSFSDRFAAATPPPVQDTPPASVRDRIAALVQPVSQDPNAPAPLTGGNNAVNADTMALPQLASMQANVKQAGPVPAPDVALPRGDPRTTSGVRATMEAALSRGGQSPAAIAGIERNVRDESGFDPNLRHPDQPGFSGEARYAHGLYQEGGDEWNNYVNWIDKNAPGSDWRDPNLQSKFLAERLQDPQYARANAEMNRPDTSPSGAAISFLRGYLKPAPQYMAQRTEQYARENNDPAYANKQIAQGGDTGSATVGGRAGPGGREGGAPPEDARDLVTQALLSQQQQKPQEQATSDDYLPDVVGMTNRSTLPQRPTAALGRAGVQGDVSLPTLQPMGSLPGAPTPAAGTPPGTLPGSPQGGDPRDAIAAAIAAQQSPDVPLADPTAAGAVAPIAPQGPQGPQPTMTDIQPAPVGGPGDVLAQATAQAPQQPPPPTYAQRPSQDLIPPQAGAPPFPDPGKPPTRAPDLGPSKSMDYWMQKATDPMLSPDDRAFAAQKYQQEDTFRQQRQKEQDADYANRLSVYNENIKAKREYELKTQQPEWALDQTIKRLTIEKDQAERANDPVVAQQKRVDLEKAKAELAKTRQGIIATSQPGQQQPGQPPPQQTDPALGTSQSPQRSGTPNVPPVPAGIAPEKWAELQAPVQVAAVEAVQKATPQFDDAIKAIQQARTHPGREYGLGPASSVTTKIPGTDAYAFGKINDQMVGKTFLTAYNTLKGGGQISNVEGDKAQVAQARIDPNQKPKDYDAALNDLETQLRRDLETAQRKVNAPVTAWRAQGDNSSYAPDIGERKGSHQYIGGNPRDPMSWRKIQ
jgi:hypothetical protein